VAEARRNSVGPRDIVALGAPHDGRPHARSQVRILAVGPLISSHARIPNGLDDQREQLVDADGARFVRGRRVDPFDQIHVPGAAQRRSFGENGAARAHQPVRALLGLEQRDPQARPAEGDPLKLVEELRLLAGAVGEHMIGQREKAAPGTETDEMGSLGEPAACFLLDLDMPQDGLARVRGAASHLRAEYAGHVHLPDFLLERHARRQVLVSLLEVVEAARRLPLRAARCSGQDVRGRVTAGLHG